MIPWTVAESPDRVAGRSVDIERLERGRPPPLSMCEIASLVNAAAWKKLLFLPHAVRQMSRSDRMISVQEGAPRCFAGGNHRGLSRGRPRP